jgi:hypothetical protein
MKKYLLHVLFLLALEVQSGKSATDVPTLGPAATFYTSSYFKGAMIGATAAAGAIYIAKKSCDKNDQMGAGPFVYVGALVGGVLGGCFAGENTVSTKSPSSASPSFIERMPNVLQGLVMGADIGTKCAEVGRFLSRSEKYGNGPAGHPMVAAQVLATSLIVGYSALLGAETLGKRQEGNL